VSRCLIAAAVRWTESIYRLRAIADEWTPKEGAVKPGFDEAEENGRARLRPWRNGTRESY